MDDDYRKRHREAYERRMREQQEASGQDSSSTTSSNPASQPSDSVSHSIPSPRKAQEATQHHVDKQNVSSPTRRVAISSQESSGVGNCTAAPRCGVNPAGSSPQDDVMASRLAADDDLASMEEARRLQRQFDGEAEGYRAPDAAYQECLISDEPGSDDIFSGAAAGVASLFFSPGGTARAANVPLAGARETAGQASEEGAGVQADMSDEDFARRLQEAEFRGLPPELSNLQPEVGVSGSLQREEAAEGLSFQSPQWETSENSTAAVVGSSPEDRGSNGGEGEDGNGNIEAPGVLTQTGAGTNITLRQGTVQHPVPIEDAEGAARASPTGNAQNPIVLDDPDEAMLQAAIAQSLIDM